MNTYKKTKRKLKHTIHRSRAPLRWILFEYLKCMICNIEKQHWGIRPLGYWNFRMIILHKVRIYIYLNSCNTIRKGYGFSHHVHGM
jgi:hypothetical protein